MKTLTILTALMLAGCGSTTTAPPPVKDTTIDTCAEARAALFEADGKAATDAALALVADFCG